jgi:hypothetical protein
LPGIVAHAAHIVGELTGAFIAELIAELFDLAAGAGTGGDGIGDGPC